MMLLVISIQSYISAARRPAVVDSSCRAVGRSEDARRAPTPSETSLNIYFS